MGYEWTYTCACKRAPGVCGGVVVGFDMAETGMEDSGAEVRVEEKDPFGFNKFLERLGPVKKEADRPVAACADTEAWQVICAFCGHSAWGTPLSAAQLRFNETHVCRPHPDDNDTN